MHPYWSWSLLFQGLDGLVADAARKQLEHDAALQFRQEVKHHVTDRSAKAFYKEFQRVLESADVILEVHLNENIQWRHE